MKLNILLKDTIDLEFNDTSSNVEPIQEVPMGVCKLIRVYFDTLDAKKSEKTGIHQLNGYFETLTQ